MNQQQRDLFLERTKAHYAADMLLSGTYGGRDGEKFVGCSVGCHLHDIHPRMTPGRISRLGDKHARVAKHYGYPEWLALLQDTMFEGLPAGERERWHVQLAEALHQTSDDYDWRAALHRVHAAILRISYRTAGSASEAVKAVLDLHERASRGEAVSDEAEWAEESAEESAAEWAAWSAEESAAEWAAWSAEESAAEWAAWSAAYQEMRDGVLAALAPSAA